MITPSFSPQELTFTSFEMDDTMDDAGDCMDHVQVAYEGLDQKFCGNTAPGPFTIPPSAYPAFVRLRSNGDTAAAGFSATCSGVDGSPCVVNVVPTEYSGTTAAPPTAAPPTTATEAVVSTAGGPPASTAEAPCTAAAGPPPAGTLQSPNYPCDYPPNLRQVTFTRCFLSKLTLNFTDNF